MEDTPNVTISQESYDNLINASVALVNQLRQKKRTKQRSLRRKKPSLLTRFSLIQKRRSKPLKSDMATISKRMRSAKSARLNMRKCIAFHSQIWLT